MLIAVFGVVLTGYETASAEKEPYLLFWEKGLKFEAAGNRTEAVRWFRKAAEQGYAPAKAKLYTVSEASSKILARLNTPVEVILYITPQDEMPTAIAQLEQDITDKLEGLKIAASGNLAYKTVYLEAGNVLPPPDEEGDANDDRREDAIEERMRDKGVTPFEVNDKLVYSSIGLACRDRKEEIIPNLMPQELRELEYRLVRTLCMLTRKKAPVIALVAPKEAFNNIWLRKIYEQMGQPVPTTEDPYKALEPILSRYGNYDVRRVQLTQESPLPNEYDTLVVINPRGLSERQRWEIGCALRTGKAVVIAVQNYEWDYRSSSSGLSLTKRDELPQVNELLEEYGLGISDDILMDANHSSLTIQSSNPSGDTQRVTLPTHIIVKDATMDKETIITRRLSSIIYLWGSALDIDADKLNKHGLEAKVIMSSSDESWTIGKDAPLTEASFKVPASGTKSYPLMAMVSGQFPDAFPDNERPAWPGEPPMPEKGDVKSVTPTPGKLLLIGCSEMFREDFLLRAGNGTGDIDLIINSVDAVTLGDDLVNVLVDIP